MAGCGDIENVSVDEFVAIGLGFEQAEKKKACTVHPGSKYGIRSCRASVSNNFCDAEENEIPQTILKVTVKGWTMVST